MEGLPQFNFVPIDAKRESTAYRIPATLKESLKNIGTAHALENSGDSISFLFQFYEYAQAFLLPFLQQATAQNAHLANIVGDYEKNYSTAKESLFERNKELASLTAKYEDCKQNLENALAANAQIVLEPNQCIQTFTAESKKAFMLLCKRAGEMGFEVNKEDPGLFINQIIEDHCATVEASRKVSGTVLTKLANK